MLLVAWKCLFLTRFCCIGSSASLQMVFWCYLWGPSLSLILVNSKKKSAELILKPQKLLQPQWFVLLWATPPPTSSLLLVITTTSSNLLLIITHQNTTNCTATTQVDAVGTTMTLHSVLPPISAGKYGLRIQSSSRFLDHSIRYLVRYLDLCGVH